MSHWHDIWHIGDLKKVLLNVDKCYEILAEYPEKFSDGNKQ